MNTKSFFLLFNTTWVICNFFKGKQSKFKHGGFIIETRGGNSNFNVICNITDFNAKQTKSKLGKYKISNNNTSTKHEFKFKYEGY